MRGTGATSRTRISSSSTRPRSPARWRARARRRAACAARSSATSRVADADLVLHRPLKLANVVDVLNRAARHGDAQRRHRSAQAGFLFPRRRRGGPATTEASECSTNAPPSATDAKPRRGSRSCCASIPSTCKEAARVKTALDENTTVFGTSGPTARSEVRGRDMRRSCLARARADMPQDPTLARARGAQPRPGAPQPARLSRRQPARRSRAHHAARCAAARARSEAQGVPFAGPPRRRSSRIAATALPSVGLAAADVDRARRTSRRRAAAAVYAADLALRARAFGRKARAASRSRRHVPARRAGSRSSAISARTSASPRRCCSRRACTRSRRRAARRWPTCSTSSTRTTRSG